MTFLSGTKLGGLGQIWRQKISGGNEVMVNASRPATGALRLFIARMDLTINERGVPAEVK